MPFQPALPPDSATYATRALQVLVAEAAVGNRLPPGLASYRAAVETEFAVAARRETGVEAVFTVEQVASVLRWTRAGYYDQHVVGDRARQTGFGVSLLSIARTGWASPVTYGNRLLLRRRGSSDDARADSTAGRPAGRARRGGAPGDTTPVVHPLAADRDRYYRFSGGDTVAVARAGGRRVAIVRVLVTPRSLREERGEDVLGPVPGRFGVFRGELDLDAETRAVVRLRGRFLVAGRAGGGVAGRAFRALAPRATAYVEYVNAERTTADGARYWLPATQRVEAQVGSPLLGDARAVVRIVSRFRDMAVNDTALPPAELAADPDTLPRRPRRLTLARGDSLGRYAGWSSPLGAASGALHADDFADLTPGALAPTGPPAAGFFVPRASDFFHFNRVDGAFVGAGGRLRFRDVAPGLTLAAAGGYAGGARTLRGHAELAQRLGPGRRVASPADGAGAGAVGGAPAYTLSLTAGRLLALTNDFRSPLDSGSSFGALLGVDDYDYVDRRWAGLALARAGGGRALAMRAEAGWAEDAGPGVAAARGLLGGRFRANRGADGGRYLRSLVALEWHPDVGAEFARPGLNARLLAERGDPLGGTPGAPLGVAGLRYTRVEARLAGRREVDPAGALGRRLGGGTLVLAARADAGAVVGAGGDGPPPQQLFELGGREGLFGYAYKAFAGDRAAVGRAAAIYSGPFLRTPMRVRRFVFPGLAPGVAVGAQAGRAEASGEGARRAIARLGARAVVGADGSTAAGPASRPTDGWRAGVTAGATFFGGSVFVGGARAVDGRRDRAGGWRTVVAFGQVL